MMKVKLTVDRKLTHQDLLVPGQDGLVSETAYHQRLQAIRAELQAGRLTRQQYEDKLYIEAKAGTVIEHPLSFLLVMLGVAEPDDQECVERLAVWTKRRVRGVDALSAAQAAREKLERGQATGDSRFDAPAVVTT